MVFKKTSPVLHETVSKAPLLADFNHEQEEFIKSKGGKEQVHMALSNPVLRKLNVQGDFFNWPPPEFAKCWPVRNRFRKNLRVPDWPPLYDQKKSKCLRTPM